MYIMLFPTQGRGSFSISLQDIKHGLQLNMEEVAIWLHCIKLTGYDSSYVTKFGNASQDAYRISIYSMLKL